MVCVLPRVGFKERFSTPRAVAVSRRDLLFFRERVGEDHRALAVEEVEDAILHAAVVPTELVEAFTQILGQRPARRMAARFQKLDSLVGLLAHRKRFRLEELEYRARPVFLLVENRFNHPSGYIL